MRDSTKAMTQDARTAATSRKKNSAATAKSDGHGRGGAELVFQHYEAAVLLLQQGKYEKALSALEKLLSDSPAEIRDRCRMYISTCQRQLQVRGRSFPTPEEHYDYAISLLNTGYYEEAREQFEPDSATITLAPTTLFTGWRCWKRSPATPRTAFPIWRGPSN